MVFYQSYIPQVGYGYRSGVFLQDDFETGGTSSGSIGLLGFNTSNGTTTQQQAVAGRPGFIRRDTTTTSATIASLYLDSATALASSELHTVTWIARLNTNDANTTVRVGSAVSVVGNPPTNGIYFEKLDADTNWFGVTISGGSSTRVDTGIAVNTNFVTFNYIRSSSSVSFYINGSFVGANILTIPTAVFQPFVQIVNSSAASKTIDIDYFALRVTGLAR